MKGFCPSDIHCFWGQAENPCSAACPRRLPQTIDSTRLAVRKNVLFVRVHDVKENVAAIKEEYDKING